MPFVIFVLVTIEISPPVCTKKVKYLYLFEKQLGSGRKEEREMDGVFLRINNSNLFKAAPTYVCTSKISTSTDHF